VRISGSLVIAAFALCGCKKESASGCMLIQTKNYSNGVLVASAIYEYDGQNRIKSVTLTNGDRHEYSYYSDSTLIMDRNARTTYYLNSNGLATSSRTVFNPNPDGLQYDNTYTYNAEGYLTGTQRIFHHVVNGNIVGDTSGAQFTWDNGNLVRTMSPWPGGSEALRYEYGDQKADNAFLDLAFYDGYIYLGKKSKNLVSKIEDDSGNLMYTRTYKFDDGRLVRLTNSGTDGPKDEVYFSYQCK
jgi:YD repeat-containing protein